MTPEQQLLFDQLTALQKKLCTILIGNPALSQREAYYAAGGKAKSDDVADASASEILANPKVKPFMESMRLQAIDDAIMTREEALKTLSMIGRTHLKDIVKFSTVNIGKDLETGADLSQTAWEINADLQETDSDKLIIISELEVGKFGPKIKTHSPVAAIKQLAEMQGWNAATKHEITGKNGGPIMTSHSDFYADDDDGEGES
jgi:phage terminase small subunit